MTIEYAVKKRITLPLLKMDDSGQPIYVLIQTAIAKAKENPEIRSRATKDGQKMAPPELAQCINLETGEECQIIVPVVLSSELKETYPNDGYVGKQFRICKFKSAAGKKYSTFQIAEIEVKTERKPSVPVTTTQAKGTVKK